MNFGGMIDWVRLAGTKLRDELPWNVQSEIEQCLYLSARLEEEKQRARRNFSDPYYFGQRAVILRTLDGLMVRHEIPYSERVPLVIVRHIMSDPARLGEAEKDSIGEHTRTYHYTGEWRGVGSNTMPVFEER